MKRGFTIIPNQWTKNIIYSLYFMKKNYMESENNSNVKNRIKYEIVEYCR